MQSVSSLAGKLQMECPTQMSGVRIVRLRSSAFPRAGWPEQNGELSLQSTHVSPASTAGLSGGPGARRDLCGRQERLQSLACLGARGYRP